MKKNTLFVITSMTPGHFDTPRTCFTHDLQSSGNPSKWVSFHSWDKAKAWADENKIKLNDMTHIILRYDFEQPKSIH